VASCSTSKQIKKEVTYVDADIIKVATYAAADGAICYKLKYKDIRCINKKKSEEEYTDLKTKLLN